MLDVEVDEFVGYLPAREMRMLVKAGLTTEKLIRESFAKDGGLYIGQIYGFGNGSLRILQDGLLALSQGKEPYFYSMKNRVKNA
ncbi:MAG: hypothetical protein ACRYGK_01695 [Janthinobacterium lividum]